MRILPDSCHSPCWMCLAVSCASSCLSSSLSPETPSSHLNSCRCFYLLAGDHQLCPLHSLALALRLFLSLERTATSGEAGNQPGDSHSQSSLSGFTCTITETTHRLCYMSIMYAHACTRSLSRQVITCRRE